MDILDAYAELPESAQNLPAVIPKPVWAPEKIVTFIGKNGRSLTIHLPARRVDGDRLPSIAKRVEAIFTVGSTALAEDAVPRMGVE